jgi:putative oxidoreductase
MTNTLILRIALAVVLLAHSIPSIFTGAVNDFGRQYLNAVGFAPVGLFLAWAIKLSHVASAVCLILDKYVKLASIITIFILVTGIIMIHYKEGWFVVGGGRNGVEFNFLLIMVFLSLIFPKGFVKSNT